MSRADGTESREAPGSGHPLGKLLDEQLLIGRAAGVHRGIEQVRRPGGVRGTIAGTTVLRDAVGTMRKTLYCP